MSLAKTVVKAIDLAFRDPVLSEFSRLEAEDGDRFCRYYQKSEKSEREISVFRDKWWTKSGGTAAVELFCLSDEVQKALGGCKQSWLKLDYDEPIVYFSYRSSRDAEDTVVAVRSSDDAARLGGWLAEFLVKVGLPWFQNFDSTERVTAYLEHEKMHLFLARWHAHLGNRASALDCVQAYLLEYPRQIEHDLSELESVGLITAADRRLILNASIQHQEEYERRVQRWCESRGT